VWSGGLIRRPAEAQPAEDYEQAHPGDRGDLGAEPAIRAEDDGPSPGPGVARRSTERHRTETGT
jgi:hypothetical protein